MAGPVKSGVALRLPPRCQTQANATLAGFRTPFQRRLVKRGPLCYKLRMTTTLTIRLPARLAKDLKARTRRARTTPTEVLRRAAENYVRSDQTSRNAVVEHIRARAGGWNGDVSGEELLRRTRP